MSIKIVLPEGDDIKTPLGTKVFTKRGYEIENITRIQIDMTPDEILQAVITVPISEIENLEGIEGIVVAVPEAEAE